MRLLGIDYGTKRVGIALSDKSGSFAFPNCVLKNDENLFKNISDICRREEVKKIILGQSLNYKGEVNPIMKDAELLKLDIEETLHIPVEYESEFLTSVEAERIQGRGKMLDASAAALILKSYIDKHNKTA